MNSTAKPKSAKTTNKTAIYSKYNNLIQELGQYMPQFKVTINDLHEPTQSFVIDFYADVLNEFFCDVDNLTSIQVDQNLDYKEMYCEIVPILNMCTALRHMYSKLGIDDFGLNDICDPSPKRTYNLFQVMINFIKYSDLKISEADTKMKGIRNMKNTYDRLIKQRETILNTVNQKSLDGKQREAEINIVVDDINSAKNELRTIHKQREETLKKMSNLKQEQEEIEKKCSKLNKLKDNIKRDVNASKAQIVEAPDLLKADYEQLKRFMSAVIEKKSAMMDLISSKKNLVVLFEQELAAQEKRICVLIDVTETNERLLKLTRELETMFQQKSELSESSEDFKEKIESIERGRANINYKINNFGREMDREYITYKSEYNALQKKLEDNIKQKNFESGTIKLLENEINTLNLHKKQMEIDVINIMKEFEEAKNTLNKMQNHYNSEILKRNNLDNWK